MGNLKETLIFSGRFPESAVDPEVTKYVESVEKLGCGRHYHNQPTILLEKSSVSKTKKPLLTKGKRDLVYVYAMTSPLNNNETHQSNNLYSFLCEG